MISADLRANRFLLGLDLMEDPWGAKRPKTEAPGSAAASAGLHCAAGLWGVFMATAMWWSYAFVTTVQPIVMVAQAR